MPLPNQATFLREEFLFVGTNLHGALHTEDKTDQAQPAAQIHSVLMKQVI